MKTFTEHKTFTPSTTLKNILHETPIQHIFHQLHEAAGPLNGLAAHLERTALNAGYLGRTLNWPVIMIYYAMRAALLHDVGKLHASIKHLNFAHTLDIHTKSLFKRHTDYGKMLLSQMGYYVEGNIAFHHHERIDGTGYNKTLLNWPMAEIVGLSDVYTALTEDRNHREQFSPTDAVDMIRAGECGRFRESYVDILQQCHKRNLLQ